MRLQHNNSFLQLLAVIVFATAAWAMSMSARAAGPAPAQSLASKTPPVPIMEYKIVDGDSGFDLRLFKLYQRLLVGLSLGEVLLEFALQTLAYCLGSFVRRHSGPFLQKCLPSIAMPTSICCCCMVMIWNHGCVS